MGNSCFVSRFTQAWADYCPPTLSTKQNEGSLRSEPSVIAAGENLPTSVQRPSLDFSPGSKLSPRILMQKAVKYNKEIQDNIKFYCDKMLSSPRKLLESLNAPVNTSVHKSDTLVERGLSMNALKSIMNEYNRLRGELKQDLVEPELAEYIHSELYGDEKERENIGIVNIYVCCTAEQDIGELIACIRDWQAEWEKKDDKKHKTFYYWVDRFCAPAGQKTNLRDRKSLLLKARMVLTVLPTWENFGLLKKAECILEVFMVSHMAGTSFDITFPREQQAEFEKACSDQSRFTTLIEQFKMVKYEQPVGDLTEIEEKQFDAYINDGRKINMLSYRAFRSWLVTYVKDIASKLLRGNLVGNATAGEIVEEKEALDQSLSLLRIAGWLTRDNGDFSQSVTFLSRALDLANDTKSYNGLRFELALSLTENKECADAGKIMKELLISSDTLSVAHRQTAELTLVRCLVAQGDLIKARTLLEQHHSSVKDPILRNRAIAFMADLDSREKKYDSAEIGFSVAIQFLEQPTTDTTYSNALNVLKFTEHLLRKASDCTLPVEERKKAMTQAQARDWQSLPTTFCDVKGERHPDSQRAADVLLDLNKIVDPKKFRERWPKIKHGMKRVWNTKPKRSGSSIVVMHWNILADALAFADLVKDGFECDNDVLNWQKNRKDKIISEILDFQPDVVGLVEVDHYDDILSILSRFGYEGVWLKKNRDFYKDGGAIFWNRNRLKKVGELLTPLKKKDKLADQVFVSVKLAPLNDDTKSFAVGCIHLKSTKKAKGEEARLDQAKQVLNLYEENYADIPRILLADLNGESAENVTRDYEPKAHPFIVNSVFQSAYKQAIGEEPNFTSWKRRAKDEFKYTVDFVFHTEDIKPEAVLLLPNEDQFDREILLPSMNMPSDHLPLVAELEMPWSLET